MSHNLVIAPNYPNGFRQWCQWKFHNMQASLVGYSRAADSTFLYIPELKMCFDAGECWGRRPDNILLSHSHRDHSKETAWMVSRDTDKPVFCALPRQMIPYQENFLIARKELGCSAPYDLSLKPHYIFHGVEAGDHFTINNGLHHVEVFKAFHPVPSVGFGVFEKRKKLKPEYIGLPGKEIGALRKKGVEINHEIKVPLVAYSGDTDIHFFDGIQGKRILTYPTIIVECTFLGRDKDEMERASKVQHMAWKQLRPIVEAARADQRFILVHFSLRYSCEEVHEFFKTEVDSCPALQNKIVIFMGEYNVGGIESRGYNDNINRL